MSSDGLSGHFLQNGFGDRYLYEVNGTAFNKVGAEVCFARQYGPALFEENSLYIICGSDSGLLPRYIADKGVPDGSYYIFVELPAVIDLIEENTGASEFHEKIFLAAEEDWVACAKRIEFQNFVYLDKFRFVQSFAATDGYLVDYLDFVTRLQADLEKIKWSLIAELGNETFTLRQLENLPENRQTTERLRGAFTGEQAIILGGGPSLDEVLPWLSENRGRLIVFAVSRIARRLLEVGITPDFIVSIDPTGLSFDISKEMLSLGPKVIFLHKYHVVGTLLGQWEGRSFFSGPRLPWISPMNEGLFDTAGPTVTNTAIDLAVKMGCSQLLLAGVDLCHSRDGYTHALGSNERQCGPQLGTGRLWIETNSGEQAETTPDFHHAILRIGQQALSARETGCRIANLSLTAARIDNVDYAACGDVVFGDHEISAWDRINDIAPPERVAERLAYYAEALAELRRADQAFRQIKELADDGLTANASFFGKGKSAPGQKKFKSKMDRIEKKLNSDFTDFIRLVKKIGIVDFLRITQGDQGRVLESEEVEKLGRYYYEAYQKSAKRLIEVVASSALRLEERIEEEQAAPDFHMILSQWESDRQYRRAGLWRRAHPEIEIPASYAADFLRLENAFSAEMDNRETAHARRSQGFSQLSSVRGKLQLLYGRKQVDSLRHMLEALTQIDGVAAASLAALGRGYLAELESEFAEALMEYQKVIDLQDEERDLAIIEDALKRMMSLLLKSENYGDAKVVAECLASVSVINSPHYADLLWLLGEKRTALDVYAGYFEQVPGDIGAMIKVGRYYHELGVFDGARLMFNAVLEKNPENHTAKRLLSELA
jgi:tetratricopeptide (TPR) repeat protein